MDDSASFQEILSDAPLEPTSWNFFFFFLMLWNTLRAWCSWVAWITSDEDGSCNDQVSYTHAFLVQCTWVFPAACLRLFAPTSVPAHQDQVLQSQQDQPVSLRILLWSAKERGVLTLPTDTWREATCRSQRLQVLAEAPWEQFCKSFFFGPLYNNSITIQLGVDGCRMHMPRKCY